MRVRKNGRVSKMNFLNQFIDSSSWAPFILIIGLISLGAALLLFRSGILFIAEGVLLALLVSAGTIAGLSLLLAVIQIGFSLYMVFRVKQAIDFNYQLVLEKTHQIPPKITANGNGSKATY